MIKAELVKAVSDASGEKREVVEKVLNAFTDTVIEAVAKGDTVRISNFGNFVPKQSGERVGRNPLSGEPVKIEARKSMKFKVSPAVTEHITKR